MGAFAGPKELRAGCCPRTAGSTPANGIEGHMQRNIEKAAPFERVLDARLVMSVVAAGIMSFSGVVVETAMNVTFPALMSEFGVDTATVQWMTTSYLLVLALIVPTSSYLNRRFPTKRVFICAMAFYVAGIVCGMCAVSFPMLLCGRILEGIGTGIALPLMFNIITEQAPENCMGTMMGTGMLVSAMAPAVGPSLGGWLAENFGWRAIFAALLPILIVAFALGVISIRQSHEVSREPLDLLGWALLGVSFAGLVFAVSEGGVLGWTSPVVLGLFALFAVALALFVVRELRAGEPLIHLSVFKEPGFVAGLLSIMLLQFSVLGLSFLLPNYSQLVMGAGETEAGSILLLGCAVGAVMAPLSGRILDKLGPARPILCGVACALLACVAFAWLAALRIGTGLAMGVYVLFAFGQSLMVGNAMTCALGLLAAEVKSDGNAVINTLQQLSGAIGTAVVTAVVNGWQASGADMALSTMLGTRESYVLVSYVMVGSLVCAALMCWRHGKVAKAGAGA